MAKRFMSCLLLAASFAGASTFAEQIDVMPNYAKPIKVKGTIASVVVGNQNIADVAVHDSNMLFITGKFHGRTNVLVYDENDRLLNEVDVNVLQDVRQNVSVYRAAARYTYDCGNNCDAALGVGDPSKYFSDTASQQDTVREWAVPK